MSNYIEGGESLTTLNKNKEESNMTMFPVKYDIYDDNLRKTAEFNMFDDEIFEVKINTILSGNDLREIARLLDKAIEINKKGLS